MARGGGTGTVSTLYYAFLSHMPPVASIALKSPLLCILGPSTAASASPHCCGPWESAALGSKGKQRLLWGDLRHRAGIAGLQQCMGCNKILLHLIDDAREARSQAPPEPARSRLVVLRLPRPGALGTPAEGLPATGVPHAPSGLKDS